MFKKALILIGILLFFNAHLCRAATVNLGWDPNAESDLAGYKLHYGSAPRAQTPYAGTVVIPDRNATSWSLVFASGTYYFSLTAYDASGNESDFSNEVMAVVPSDEAPGKPGRPVLIQ